MYKINKVKILGEKSPKLMKILIFWNYTMLGCLIQHTFQKFLNFLLDSRNRFLTTFSKNLRNVFKSSNFCPYMSIVKIYCAKCLGNRQKNNSIYVLLLEQKIQYFGQYICMIKHPNTMSPTFGPIYEGGGGGQTILAQTRH